MAVITKAKAAGRKRAPTERIPKAQNPRVRTAKTQRNTLLVHRLEFQYQTARYARPVNTTGINRGSTTHSPLVSMKDAERFVTTGEASLPGGTAWMLTPRYAKGQNTNHKKAAQAAAWARRGQTKTNLPGLNQAPALRG